MEVDHVVPLAAGGGNDDGNLQSLCIACHRDKTRAERAAGIVARGGHRGPARRTTSLRLSDAQFAALDLLVAAGYAPGVNAVIARLIDEAPLPPRADEVGA